ncbi:MAG TPA: hypothetical protein VF331_28585 [Polyangiales bacterium]
MKTTSAKSRVATRLLAAALVLGGVLAGAASDAALAQAPGGKQPGQQPGQRVAALSDAEQLAQAQGIVQRGNDLATRVSQQLDSATRENDIIRVTCLNDKLAQINAAAHTAQGRLSALQAAVGTDARGHEFTVLTVLGQKLQVLDQEANQCLGQDLYSTGGTKTTTIIDTSLMPFEDNPSSPPVLLPPGASLGVGVIPPPASGTK